MRPRQSRVCGCIYETFDYTMFEVSNFNREVKKTKKLQVTLMREGWVNAYPVHVREKDNGKYVIVGGHHRFEVAQKLGIGIKFVVCNDNLQIYEIEDTTNPWKLPDYLKAYVQIGDTDYVKVQDLHEKTGMGIAVCTSLLSGEVGGGFNNTHNFKFGEFTVKSTLFADEIVAFVTLLKDNKLNWANQQMCVNSLARIVKAGHAELPRFKKKITKYAQLLKKQPTVQAYTDMWEDIYNYQERGNRVPIAFLTNETMRNLHEAFGKRVVEPPEEVRQQSLDLRLVGGHK